jgi:aerobic-type carbon monoxide dehydrogenase small subunit (CoxS/CutS family)
VNNLRISNHPILDFSKEREKINFTFNDELVQGYDGDTIASALHALGVKQLSMSIKRKRPRGLYCAIGNCSSCHMIVNDVANVKTCITLLEEGMKVRLQTNLGELHAK